MQPGVPQAYNPQNPMGYKPMQGQFYPHQG
jgi:hypothetical protein